MTEVKYWTTACTVYNEGIWWLNGEQIGYDYRKYSDFPSICYASEKQKDGIEIRSLNEYQKLVRNFMQKIKTDKSRASDISSFAEKK